MKTRDSLRRGRRLPSPALVISLLALFVALGGAAYAGVTRNSVGTPHLKKAAVKPAKLAPQAVRTAHVAPGAIRGNRIAPEGIDGTRVQGDSLTGDQVDESTLGMVTNAQNANRVSGFEPFRFSFGANLGDTAVMFENNDVLIRALCSLDGAAVTAENLSDTPLLISASGVDQGGSEPRFEHGDDFQPGDVVTLKQPGEFRGHFQGSFAFLGTTRVVTATFATFDDAPARGNDCDFFANGLVSSPHVVVPFP